MASQIWNDHISESEHSKHLEGFVYVEYRLINSFIFIQSKISNYFYLRKKLYLKWHALFY